MVWGIYEVRSSPNIKELERFVALHNTSVLLCLLNASRHGANPLFTSHYKLQTRPEVVNVSLEDWRGRAKQTRGQE